MPVAELGYAAAVLVAAFLIRGASGFGSGLVAIPLLAAVWPLQRVVPVIALITAFASLGLGVKERDRIRWNDFVLISAGIGIGVAAGMPVLNMSHPAVLRRILGLLVMAYAVYRLMGSRVSGRWKRFVLPLGVLGGAIDTIFGVGGPIIVIAMSIKEMGKDAFRATISVILLVDLLFRLIAYGVSGLLTPTDIELAALALPFMATGMIVGHRIYGSIGQRTFELMVAIILIASGGFLIVK